jgi:hypothetical protein
MRKRELVHMHALLDRISRALQRRGVLAERDLEEYESLGVAPTAVYEAKSDHEDAVRTLTATLASAVERQEEGDAGDQTVETPPRGDD